MVNALENIVEVSRIVQDVFDEVLYRGIEFKKIYIPKHVEIGINNDSYPPFRLVCGYDILEYIYTLQIDLIFDDGSYGGFQFGSRISACNFTQEFDERDIKAGVTQLALCINKKHRENERISRIENL